MLAACQIEPIFISESVQTEPPTADSERKVVGLALSGWAAAEIGFDRMARQFGERRGDIEIKIKTGVDYSRILEQIGAGAVDWSGIGVLPPFLEIMRKIEDGAIQPMEDLIRASEEEGAETLLDDMIDTRLGAK